MRAQDLAPALAARIAAHPLVQDHGLRVLCEADEHDLEGRMQEELAKGGLHLVLAAGEAPAQKSARRAVLLERAWVVTLAHIPGLRPPPLSPLLLAEALAGWLHGWWPQDGGPHYLSLDSEGPVPEGGDIAGRQLVLRAATEIEHQTN